MANMQSAEQIVADAVGFQVNEHGFAEYPSDHQYIPYSSPNYKSEVRKLWDYAVSKTRQAMMNPTDIIESIAAKKYKSVFDAVYEAKPGATTLFILGGREISITCDLNCE